MELRHGAGLTNWSSGAIALQSVAAGSVAVVNDGPRAGSDIELGSVMTSGVQSYADPNGITTVSGTTVAANPITFYDSVVLNDGVSVDAGYGTVNFAGSGLQTLQSGTGATLGNVLHNGTGTLQLTSDLTVLGRLTNQSVHLMPTTNRSRWQGSRPSPVVCTWPVQRRRTSLAAW